MPIVEHVASHTWSVQFHFRSRQTLGTEITKMASGHLGREGLTWALGNKETLKEHRMLWVPPDLPGASRSGRSAVYKVWTLGEGGFAVLN